MPPEPIELRIIQSVQAALAGISTSAGYHHTVAGYAVKLDPNHEVEKLIPGANDPLGPARPWVVLDISASPTFDYSERPMRVREVMPFVVHFVHDSDPKDDDARLGTFLRLCADVEQALAADIQRGGLALDTLLNSRIMRDFDGQAVEAVVSGVVRFHRGYGAPNG